MLSAHRKTAAPVSGVEVQFRLQAPAPKELVKPGFAFTDTQLIVLQTPPSENPTINHVSPLSEAAHDGMAPLKLRDLRFGASGADFLIVTPEQLKNLVVKFSAGWLKPNSSFQGFYGSVLKMEAFELALPAEYYSVIEQVKSGDTLGLLVSVNKDMRLELTINHNGALVPKADVAHGACAAKLI